MAVGILRRWAASAPVPVFVARGGGAGWRPAEMAADPRVRLVPTPRHASVLLAAGRFPGPLGTALDRVHDQLPAPRAAVWWTADADAERPAALRAASVVTGPDPVDRIVAATAPSSSAMRSRRPMWVPMCRRTSSWVSATTARAARG